MDVLYNQQRFSKPHAAKVQISIYIKAGFDLHKERRETNSKYQGRQVHSWRASQFEFKALEKSDK